MSDELITIRTYEHGAIADLDRAVLEEAGIPAFLVNSESATTDWLKAYAVGYIRLQVPANSIAQAEKLLSATNHNIASDETIIANDVGEDSECLSCREIMAGDVDTCAHCGWSFNQFDAEVVDKNKIDSRTKKNYIAIIALIIITISTIILLGIGGKLF